MPSRFSRRRFLAGIGAAAAAAKLEPLAMAARFDATAAKESFPIGFSTLGCPTWGWDKILDFAKQHAFVGVELRGLQGNMDLPTCPEFSVGRATDAFVAGGLWARVRPDDEGRWR